MVSTCVKGTAHCAKHGSAETIDGVESGPRTTGAVLEQAIVDRGLSKRALAKLLAGEGASHTEVENYRRQVYGWIAGIQPRDEMRVRLESVLGLVPGSLAAEETGHREATRNLEVRMAEREAEVEELRSQLREQRERLERLERLLQPPPGSRSFSQ